MAKDPAVLFYTSDFLSGTFTMSNEQVGKYIRLLCLQHQKGVLSEKDMINVCGTYDEDVFLKFEKSGHSFFNKRMKEEADKRQSFCESRRKSRQGAKNQANNQKTYVERMEIEIENINEDVNKDFGKSENLLNLDLPEIKIGAAIEYLSITKNVKATREMVLILWATFKEKHQEEKYASKNKAFKHFFDSLKFEQINGTHQQFNPGSGKPGTSAARIEAARKF